MDYLRRRHRGRRGESRRSARVAHDQSMGTGGDPIPGGSPALLPSSASSDAVRSFRRQLTQGENVIDPATFAGSIPQVHGIAPRVRIGHGKWFNLLWLLPIGWFFGPKALRDNAQVPYRTSHAHS